MDAIEIESPARLHLGFIDPSGSGTRRYGSLGLALDGLATRVRLAWSAADSIEARTQSAGAELPRLRQRLQALRGALNIHEPLAVELQEAIVPHAGLGSGTQLALALGYGLARLGGRELSVRQIAALGERGARSGIGIGAFEQGGFVLDGGRGPHTEVPPIIARLPFPSAWRVILLFDATYTGLHGADEVAAFARLPPFAPDKAAALAHLCLMTVLPALAEADFAAFGPAVTRIQACVGDHFAPAQGGRYASTRVAHWLAWFAAHGAVCYGQSSWGPTGFVIVASAEEARTLIDAAKRARTADDPLRLRSVAARNVGARITESRDGSGRLQRGAAS